jgi:hypothetical protein
MLMVDLLTCLAQISPDLAVYCKGGDDPPRNCPSLDYRSSQDYTKCVCMPGFYESSPAKCAACPPGHMCPQGEKIMCPQHTYQPAWQATACLNCVPGGTKDGIYSACGAGKQLAWCQPGKADDVSTNCVACSRCKRPYLPASADQVDCYRSN